MHPRRDEVEHNGAVILAFLFAFVSLLPAASVLTFIYVRALCARAHRVGCSLSKSILQVLHLFDEKKYENEKNEKNVSSPSSPAHYVSHYNINKRFHTSPAGRSI
jgi:hypothetical protein